MDGSNLEWHIFLSAASSQQKPQAIWKICLESMQLTKLLFSPWQTVCPSFPSCHPELQMLGWSHWWCEMKRVGTRSPGASQRAAGKLCLPGVVALSWPLMPALHWAPSEGSFSQVYTPFLLQLELPDVYKATFTWDVCWLLWALGGKQGGHSMRSLWKHNALVSTSTPNTAWHFPQEQLPDGCWSELVSPKSGTSRDIPNQLQHAFSCEYSNF